MKNEKTSKRAATIAGRILERLKEMPPRIVGTIVHQGVDLCTVKDLKTLAASALTQTPDRPKKTR